MHAHILTVCCTSAEYRVEHVERLAAQCARFAPKAEFRCLSDNPDVPGYYSLQHDWPGWWSKIEVYNISGPVLYMDLDTTIIGDLAPLLKAAETHPFIALRDFNPHMREMGSGLMAWSGDMRRLYAAFAADPARHMAENRTPRWWGDQGFAERHTEGRAYWQEILPGAVVSWKKHCGHGVPDGARVICFHGNPRPWEVTSNG